MQCKRCRHESDGNFCPQCGLSLRPFASFPLRVSMDLQAICGGWHNGQTSAMYSVVSTGHIHDARTLAGLASELCHLSRLSHTLPASEIDAIEKEIAWVDRILATLEGEE